MPFASQENVIFGHPSGAYISDQMPGHCDQAFGQIYRPLKGAQKWSRDITKIESLHIDT